jgi:hypothetical protein
MAEARYGSLVLPQLHNMCQSLLQARLYHIMNGGGGRLFSSRRAYAPDATHRSHSEAANGVSSPNQKSACASP